MVRQTDRERERERDIKIAVASRDSVNHRDLEAANKPTTRKLYTTCISVANATVQAVYWLKKVLLSV